MSVKQYYVDGKEEYVGNLREDEVLFEFTLPTTEKFRSNSKQGSHCPYSKFQRYVVKQLRRKQGVDVEDPNSVVQSISQVVVTPKTAEALNEAVIDWLPKYKSYLANGSRMFANTYAMLHLDAAPGVADEDFMEDNKVYIKQ